MSDLAKSHWAPQGSYAGAKYRDNFSQNRHRTWTSKPSPPAITTSSSPNPAASSAPPPPPPPSTNPKIWTSTPRPDPSPVIVPAATTMPPPKRLPRVVGGATGMIPAGWEHLASEPEPEPEPERKKMTPAAAASGTIKSTSAASENLSRYQKIRHRLEWKLKHLVDGYRQATSTAADATVEKLAFAEQMFKLDFYEYYSYLERGIVHLLLVFGLRVSGSSASSSGPRRRWGDDDDEDSNRGGYTHRYHANVLDALRDPDSPFYEVLGSGERFAQLQKAKELRNRWKYADMTPEERERDPQTWRAAYKAWKDARTPLARYDFDHMLIQILKGLAEAAELAQQRLDEVSRRAGEDTDDDSDSDDSDVSDEYDFMVDAMDWEAV